jgi:glycosyltransferase involved in cell wall biosynthesis
LSVQRLLEVERRGPAEVDCARRAVAAVFREVLRARRPDVIHVHNAHHFSGLLAEALFAEASVPVVNTVHDRVGEYLHPEVLDMAWAHVLYASHYLAEALATSRPHSVVWLGIDLQRFTPDGPSDPRLSCLPRPILFHPARLLRWKGVHVSVAALALLAECGLDATLVLCGSDQVVDDRRELGEYRRELSELARRLGVAERVHFEVFDRDHIPDAYRASDLVWYPTIEAEPYGLVPLEAMATGVAIIASDCGGMRETVDHGRTGLRVPPGDASALAAATAELLEDDSLRGAMTGAALEHVSAFGLESYVDAVEKVYAEAVG